MSRAATVQALDDMGPKEGAEDRGDVVEQQEVEQADRGDTVEAQQAPETPPQEEKPRRERLTIPKARFDEMSAKSRAQLERAEARINELEQQLKRNQGVQLEEVDNALDELESRYLKLVMDGAADEAKALRKEIREIERRYASVQAADMASHVRADAVDSVRLDMVIEELESSFSFLDPNSEDFVPDVSEEILDVYNAFLARGYQKSAAMQRAATYVLNSLDIEYDSDVETEAAPTDSEVMAAEGRRRDAVTRNLDAARRQPPATEKFGKAGAPRSHLEPSAVETMPQRDFEKLSEDELRRLRGDVVE